MATANLTMVKLSFHKGSGNYCKTVNGHRFYLGRDHDEALETWFKHKADFEAGIDPRKVKRQSTARQLTVVDGCNLFLHAKKSEVQPKTWDNLRDTARKVRDFFGESCNIAALGPDHFIRLKEYLDNGNPLSLGNSVQRSKQIFKWLAERKHIDLPDFGPDFKKPGKKALRRHRRKQADRTLTPREIIAAINELGLHYRAAALLGINAAFGPSDCVELPIKVVDLQNKLIDWVRPKTETLRKSPLWPETVEALELSARYRPPETKRGQFFHLNKISISRNFQGALQTVGAQRAGASFYSLRHSFATVAREANDDAAVRIIMGHVDDSILDENYTHRFPRERLDTVSEHVRQWLFGGRKSR